MPVSACYCRIEMLGTLRVVLPDRTFDRFRTQKTALLLAYLAHHSHRAHSREYLIEMLWPDADLDAGRDSLTTALASLRRQLEPKGLATAGSVLAADRQKARLNPDAFTTDAADFERLLKRALPADSPLTPTERAARLQQAVDLYRGDFLSGHYADWVTLEQTRLTERYGVALLTLAELREQSGDLDSALTVARKALVADPYGEEACHLLMRLHARRGQPNAALEAYRKLEKRLRDDLGAAPDRPLRDLAEQIRRAPETFKNNMSSARPAAPVSSSPPAAASPTSEPVPTAAPPPAPVSLPLQTTAFFGRDRELAQISGLLTPGASEGQYAPKRRLVTLTGPGGVGKTRLAIEAAGGLSSAFPGGVWFVSLADVPHPRLLPFALAHALQAQPAPNADLLEGITAKLSVGPALLLLDNFEHLLREGPEPKTENIRAADAGVLVRLLLERIPRLSVLVTSRRALGLGGEQEFALPALAAPEQETSPEELLDYSSVALYQDRAQYVLPDFALTPRNAGAIARLCRKLEGMPLAIEMAAAWVKTLSPAQMLERLEPRLDMLVSRRRDAPQRQRSLRATIEWSYDLLEPDLQALFAQLAVFRGGWDVEAAAGVCGLSLPACLDSLSQLQQHSLVIYEEREESGGYRLLETLRQFGCEKLTEAGELEAVRERHLRYFLDFVVKHERLLTGPESREGLDRLERMHDNIRAALQFSLGDTETQSFSEKERAVCGLRICAAMQDFWRVRGYWTEGRGWLLEALDKEVGEPNGPLRADVLTKTGHLVLFQGEYALARSLIEQSRSLQQNLGDRAGLAASLHQLAHIAHLQADYPTAHQHYTESLELRTRLGDKVGAAQTLNNLANVALSQNAIADARTLHEQSLALRRELGYDWGIAQSLHNLALVAWEEGDLAAMRQRIAESLELHVALRDKSGIVMVLEDFGQMLAQSQPLCAARLWGAAESLRQEMGLARHPTEQFLDEAEKAAKAQAGPAFDTAWAEGRQWSLEEAVAHALEESRK